MTTEHLYGQSHEVAVTITYLNFTIVVLCLLSAGLLWTTWHELHRHFQCVLPIPN